MKLRLRSYQPGDAPAFRNLNEAWINAHFSFEEKDRITLGDPDKYILAPGGHIFFAEDEDTREIIGCCALARMIASEFELSKMAVDEQHRGRGIGRKLMESVVSQARLLRASRLYLETHHSLTNAIALYRSVGFNDIPAESVIPSPYVRATVFMELFL